MKRALVLALLTPVVFSGCGGDTVRAFLGDSATPAPATPSPTPAPVAAKPAKPTPAPGDWMWKGYENPLDASKKKNQKKN